MTIQREEKNISVKHGTPVMILDSNQNIIQEFDSQLKAKAFLGCSRASVSKYLNTGELFKSKSIGDVYIISNDKEKSKSRSVSVNVLNSWCDGLCRTKHSALLSKSSKIITFLVYILYSRVYQLKL